MITRSAARGTRMMGFMAATAESILSQLDPDQLTSRLREIESERRAVLILLRAARARRGTAGRRQPPSDQRPGGDHA